MKKNLKIISDIKINFLTILEIFEIPLKDQGYQFELIDKSFWRKRDWIAKNHPCNSHKLFRKK